MDEVPVYRLMAAAVILALLLSACGPNNSPSAAPTQVVARVNGRELTVSQLNLALEQTQATDLSPAVTKRALDGLIDEELLVQAAVSAKLDRESAAILRIESARRQILARAYEESQVYPSGTISELELRNFYEANPGLFKARRIYHIVAFTTEQPQLPPAMLGDLTQARTADAQRELLNRYHVSFHSQESTRTPESMPLNIVSKLAAANPGDVIISENDTGHVELLLLTSMESSPVSYEQASPAIGHFLHTQRNEAALKVHLQQLQAAAKIEYVGNAGVTNPAQVLQN
jgi:EpsD family peptidyl-prolyl cis-trans isomerase